MKNVEKIKRQKRKWRTRKKVSGTAEVPRLCVYKSNTNVYCQLIDDINGHTLGEANSRNLELKGNRSEKAKGVGESISKIATDLNINKVLFDRNGYPYHGVVKALADAVREGGLEI